MIFYLRKKQKNLFGKVFYFVFVISTFFSNTLKADETLLGTLDGSKVSAIEYSLPSDQHAFNFGTELFPFNPYYNGIGAFVSYQYHINKNLSWEMIRTTYIFSVQTDLTSQLAEKYEVAPEKIERLFWMIKSNLKYYLVYGKSLLSDEYLNHFRVAFTAGTGVAFTKDSSFLFNAKFLVNFGLSFEVYIHDSLLWGLDFQDAIVIDSSILKSVLTYPSFSLFLKKMF